jgi:uncharacterized metal-binding protein YceD (DUF177 family)
MSEQKSPEQAWSFPVAIGQVPESGRRVDMIADAGTRAAIAKTAKLAALPHLEAGFDLTRHGADGLRVTGRVQAAVVQHCVVTLEPIESTVDETIDLLFLPDSPVASEVVVAGLQAVEGEDPPETLQDGMVDLGAVATEFLLLGLDPYPRKPDAVFEAPATGDPAGNPFAVLAALKNGGGGKER